MYVDRAESKDIPAIAAIFTESFKPSVLHHCGGKLPSPQAMQDVFSLLLAAEPPAALVARTPGGEVAGYCFAPSRLSGIWLRAVFGGHIFKWAWRWLTGRYGFGFHPVRIILLNKAAFLRSSVAPVKAADARILSIAVRPGYRGQGLATLLMTEAEKYFVSKKVRRIRLEVRPDNGPAIRVYEKFGFGRAGSTYDSQGEWLIMMKEMRQSGNV